MGYNDFGNPRTTADPYTIDSKIGRSDSRDVVRFSEMVVTTTPSLVPASPLGRRNYIFIKNEDSLIDVYVSTFSGTGGTGDPAYKLSAGTGTWEEYTDGTFYISTASGTADVRVYERAPRFNYKK